MVRPGLVAAINLLSGLPRIGVFSQASDKVGRKFSQAYLDQLFSAPDFSKFVEINGYLVGSDAYDRSQPTYGFPEPVFVFTEGLIWFSQAIRSGVWTYYEATPPFRQEAMLRALKEHAPKGFAAKYALGMKNWQRKSKMAGLDEWIRDHEDDCNRWLWHLITEHRPTLEVLCGQITTY
jgi:hypothetical protein